MPEGYLKELKRSEERKAEILKYLQEYFPDQAKIIFEAGCGHGHGRTGREPSQRRIQRAEARHF